MEEANTFYDLTREQQSFIISFCEANFRPVQKINPRHSAYGLKQSFTRKYFYVTQGQFTEAMRLAGFAVEPTGHGNARFNIGESSPYLKSR